MEPSDQSSKPFEASFSNADRYTPPTQSDCVVQVDGEPCPGTILGRNGPRTQVRFQRAEETYVRWFDTDDVEVFEEPP